MGSILAPICWGSKPQAKFWGCQWEHLGSILAPICWGSKPQPKFWCCQGEDLEDILAPLCTVQEQTIMKFLWNSKGHGAISSSNKNTWLWGVLSACDLNLGFPIEIFGFLTHSPATRFTNCIYENLLALQILLIEWKYPPVCSAWMNLLHHSTNIRSICWGQQPQ